VGNEYRVCGSTIRSAGNEDFWEWMEHGGWEPGTLRFIRDAAKGSLVFIDVGAWIGPVSLFAASVGFKVYAFEPDSVAYGTIEENISLNPLLATKIELSNSAFGTQAGEALLHHASGFGDSQSSLLTPTGRASSGQPVKVLDGVAFLLSDAVPNNSVVKIDIEGGEYLILPKLRKVARDKCLILMISTHPERTSPLFGRKSPDLIKRVFAMVFSLSRSLVLVPYYKDFEFWEDKHHSVERTRLDFPRFLWRIFGGRNCSFYLLPR